MKLYLRASLPEPLPRREELGSLEDPIYPLLVDLDLKGIMTIQNATLDQFLPTNLKVECWDRDEWNRSPDVEDEYHFGFELNGVRFSETYLNIDPEEMVQDIKSKNPKLWWLLKERFIATFKLMINSGNGFVNTDLLPGD